MTDGKDSDLGVQNDTGVMALAFRSEIRRLMSAVGTDISDQGVLGHSLG